MKSAQDRSYRIRGLRVPGVTDVCGILNKPALNRWRETMGTQAADDAGQFAAKRGTLIHDAALLMSQGKAVMPGSDDSLLDRCVANLQGWLSTNLVETLLAETPVYSTAWMYAGRPDFVGVVRFDGRDRFAVLDWKGSKATAAYYEWNLQTAAYAMTDEVRKLAGRHKIYRATITINPEGDCTPRVWAFDETPRRQAAFLNLLSVYNDRRAWEGKP